MVASLNGEGQIQLLAEDGRNIAIGATGTARNLGFADGTVQGGTLTLTSKDTYTLQFAAEEVNTDALGNIADLAGGGINNIVNGGWDAVGRITFTPGDSPSTWDATTDILSVTGTYDSTVGGFRANENFYVIFRGGNVVVSAGNDNDVSSVAFIDIQALGCLLYTSPSPRD